jgi:uncharacterized protein (UPF0276 family)
MGCSGAGLLPDIDNEYVTSVNRGVASSELMHALPLDLVGETPLAGNSSQTFAGVTMLADTHDAPARDAVSPLYEHAPGRLSDLQLLCAAATQLVIGPQRRCCSKTYEAARWIRVSAD